MDCCQETQRRGKKGSEGEELKVEREGKQKKREREMRGEGRKKEQIRR